MCPVGTKIDRIALPTKETDLDACLRRYPKNDSLIAWHLGIPIEQVRAARAAYKPLRVVGQYLQNHGALDDSEYRRRQDKARKSNEDYMAALERARG
jgi:hypothetical protein